MAEEAKVAAMGEEAHTWEWEPLHLARPRETVRRGGDGMGGGKEGWFLAWYGVRSWRALTRTEQRCGRPRMYDFRRLID